MTTIIFGMACLVVGLFAGSLAQRAAQRVVADEINIENGHGHHPHGDYETFRQQQRSKDMRQP